MVGKDFSLKGKTEYDFKKRFDNLFSKAVDPSGITVASLNEAYDTSGFVWALYNGASGSSDDPTVSTSAGAGTFINGAGSAKCAYGTTSISTGMTLTLTTAQDWRPYKYFYFWYQSDGTDTAADVDMVFLDSDGNTLYTWELGASATADVMKLYRLDLDNLTNLQDIASIRIATTVEKGAVVFYVNAMMLAKEANDNGIGYFWGTVEKRQCGVAYATGVPVQEDPVTGQVIAGANEGTRVIGVAAETGTTAGEYYWVQTSGVVAGLIGGASAAIVAGDDIMVITGSVCKDSSGVTKTFAQAMSLADEAEYFVARLTPYSGVNNP